MPELMVTRVIKKWEKHKGSEEACDEGLGSVLKTKRWTGMGKEQGEDKY